MENAFQYKKKVKIYAKKKKYINIIMKYKVKYYDIMTKSYSWIWDTKLYYFLCHNFDWILMFSY